MDPKDCKLDCGPAFPILEKYSSCEGATGMTLRDYFAAAAMAGMLADPDVPCGKETAKNAYSMADAMLAERAK